MDKGHFLTSCLCKRHIYLNFIALLGGFLPKPIPPNCMKDIDHPWSTVYLPRLYVSPTSRVYNVLYI